MLNMTQNKQSILPPMLNVIGKLSLWLLVILIIADLNGAGIPTILGLLLIVFSLGWAVGAYDDTE